MVDGLSGIECAHCVLYDGGDACGVGEGAYQQNCVEAEAGQIDFGLRVGLDSEVMRVRDHSNDGDLLRGRTQHAEKNVCAERVAAGEEAPGESGVDDEFCGAVLDVFLLKGSAALESKAEGVEEAGAHIADLRGGKSAGRSGRRAFNEKARHDLRGPERNDGCGGGG